MSLWFFIGTGLTILAAFYSWSYGVPLDLLNTVMWMYGSTGLLFATGALILWFQERFPETAEVLKWVLFVACLIWVLRKV